MLRVSVAMSATILYSWKSCRFESLSSISSSSLVLCFGCRFRFFVRVRVSIRVCVRLYSHGFLIRNYDVKFDRRLGFQVRLQFLFRFRFRVSIQVWNGLGNVVRA
jgi:DNA-directed RNA polymerase subunit RPC12/RpoP